MHLRVGSAGVLAMEEVDDDTLITVDATNAVTCVSDDVTTATSTTVPDEVLPTVVTTTTLATTTSVFSEVLPTEVTTSTGPAVVAETLPFTGSTDLGWLLLAGEILVLGSILVITSRGEQPGSCGKRHDVRGPDSVGTPRLADWV